MNTSFNDMARKILAVFPDATFGEDNEGQLIIYTDTRVDSGDNLIPFIMPETISGESNF